MTTQHQSMYLCIFLVFISVLSFSSSLSVVPIIATRTQFLSQVLITVSPFVTKASTRVELTNSITASYDTNISPLEAYQVIRQQIPPRGDSSKRCLDVGAGAGLSTSVLYQELGYIDHLDAVDWSDKAWNDNVQSFPETVYFYAMDDESFFQSRAPDDKYDVICYNFAINPTKAAMVATTYLTPQGVLLAPVNDQRDYWYKQSYYKLNSKAQVLWKSSPEIGAWSVQFQPDVTSTTCTGIWCQGFNGYKPR